MCVLLAHLPPPGTVFGVLPQHPRTGPGPQWLHFRIFSDLAHHLVLLLPSGAARWRGRQGPAGLGFANAGSRITGAAALHPGLPWLLRTGWPSCLLPVCSVAQHVSGAGPGVAFLGYGVGAEPSKPRVKLRSPHPGQGWGLSLDSPDSEHELFFPLLAQALS